VSTYGFNDRDAKRIGKAVRQSERMPPKVKLGGPQRAGANPGVRLMIGKHAGTSWATATTALVTIYNDNSGSLASVGTVVAYNQYVKFAEQTNCTNRWVALGHNGFHWLPIDAVAECGTCSMIAGGIDFQAIPGFNPAKIQLLGHSAYDTAATTEVCIRWYDTTTCTAAT